MSTTHANLVAPASTARPAVAYPLARVAAQHAVGSQASAPACYTCATGPAAPFWPRKAFRRNKTTKQRRVLCSRANFIQAPRKRVQQPLPLSTVHLGLLALELLNETVYAKIALARQQNITNNNNSSSNNNNNNNTKQQRQQQQRQQQQ